MTSKSAGCGDCCCSVCSVALPKDVETCCQCICSDICITVTGPEIVGTAIDDCLDPAIPTGTGTDGICDCSESKTKIAWDADECAYIGTVTCGPGLSIDLRFEVKQCANVDTGTGTGSGTLGPEDDCHLCLTSDCLGFNGVCPDECQEFAAGNINGDCGKYLKDCDQSGGWDKTWTVDASDCGDLDCTSISINVQCSDRINPAGIGVDRICECCDCVCRCVCITYEEDNCISQTKKVCWQESGTGTESGYWEVTFEDCDLGEQTIKITLEKATDSNKCVWRLTPTRGTVYEQIALATGTGTGTSEALTTILAECPEADLNWTIDVDETGTSGAIGRVTVRCADCEECEETFCCCPDDPLPTVLTVTVYNVQFCDCFNGVEVTLNLITTTEEGGGRTGTWEGTASVCDDENNPCEIRFFLFCTTGCDWSLTYCATTSTETVDEACVSSPQQVLGVGSCAGSSAVQCCNPFFLPFGGINGSDDFCCNPSEPASAFCAIVTE